MNTFSKKTARKVTSSLKKLVASNQSWTCAICKNLLNHLYQVDHIVPHSVSHNDSPSNLQALCVNCHALKTSSEQPRICLHQSLMYEVGEQARVYGIESNAVCFSCHRVVSTYFKHVCDNRGDKALYEEI